MSINGIQFAIRSQTENGKPGCVCVCVCVCVYGTFLSMAFPLEAIGRIDLVE